MIHNILPVDSISRNSINWPGDPGAIECKPNGIIRHPMNSAYKVKKPLQINHLNPVLWCCYTIHTNNITTAIPTNSPLKERKKKLWSWQNSNPKWLHCRLIKFLKFNHLLLPAGRGSRKRQLQHLFLPTEIDVAFSSCNHLW